jgi:hypothetical protein
LTPEALDVVSVVLEACPEAAVCEAWVTMTSLICPFRSCLEEYTVRADRAFLALPKYVGFFESFLKYEPAAATDMPAGRSLLHSAVFSLSR